jgi:hypothetical protein
MSAETMQATAWPRAKRWPFWISLALVAVVGAGASLFAAWAVRNHEEQMFWTEFEQQCRAWGEPVNSAVQKSLALLAGLQDLFSASDQVEPAESTEVSGLGSGNKRRSLAGLASACNAGLGCRQPISVAECPGAALCPTVAAGKPVSAHFRGASWVSGQIFGREFGQLHGLGPGCEQPEGYAGGGRVD